MAKKSKIILILLVIMLIVLLVLGIYLYYYHNWYYYGLTTTNSIQSGDNGGLASGKNISNGTNVLQMQSDGNLVLLKNTITNPTPVQYTGTKNAGAYLSFGNDGTLRVMPSSGSTALWSSTPFENATGTWYLKIVDNNTSTNTNNDPSLFLISPSGNAKFILLPFPKKN